MKYTTSILTLALLASTGAAWATDPAHTKSDARMDHSKMDMSKSEMDHGQMKGKEIDTFTKLDTNKDGKVSKVEMAKDSKAAHFEMLDVNKDGSLSAAEFAKAQGM